MMAARNLTPPVDLLREPGTGPTRSRRPMYVDLLPPCNQACPVGENIQGWLADAQAGRHREAWLTLVDDNPLPAISGRVCYHPCETKCNREALDSAVGIHAVERFLGDLASSRGWQFSAEAPSGKRVLIVGGGPCGLSAGYHLARMGHAVEIHDSGASPGGMLRFGIPAYRLPRGDLMREISRIEAMGVKIVSGHAVSDIAAEKAAGSFDAALVAIGAQLDRRVEFPAFDASCVMGALRVLRDVEEGNPPQLGRRVIIYGGGDTAMDVARSARRLGAEEPLIVYHRDRRHMKAHEFELREALSEGIKVRWLTDLTSIGAGEAVVEQVTLDENGIPHPTGTIERLTADAVVLALGERAASRRQHRRRCELHDRPGRNLRRRRCNAWRAFRHYRDRTRKEGCARDRPLAMGNEGSKFVQTSGRDLRHAASADLQRRSTEEAAYGFARTAARRLRRDRRRFERARRAL
jgi:formate dehydrogenase (NADP+) beta subunit